jgi:hypothetical protein
MTPRRNQAETLETVRKHRIIREIQNAVARELAAQSTLPKTVPRRIAQLLRELHKRLRERP